MLEIQTASQDSISQMEREESELEKSVSLIEKHLQQLDFLTKNGSNQHVFLFLHRLLPILSKEDNHLEEMLADLSDVSLVCDQPETLSEIKHLGTIRLKKEPCTIRFKPFKHMAAQEISVQSKPPKSFKFNYKIDRTFDLVTGMVVDKDDNLILADQSFLRMYQRLQIRRNSLGYFLPQKVWKNCCCLANQWRSVRRQLYCGNTDTRQQYKVLNGCYVDRRQRLC
jgi:hypothetical protein